MTILSIETSCDETAAAVCQDRKILSSTILSQSIHTMFGGVVPEIASREHEKWLSLVVKNALSESDVRMNELDGVAVTRGPGLMGSLLTGVSFAMGFSQGLSIPCIGINHIEAHIFSNFIAYPELKYPFICLLVSGGHTQIWLVNALGNYELLGETRDDAAGEAFDKGAHLLGLGYPGGPAIERVGHNGQAASVRFPRGRLKKHAAPAGLQSDLCFSFSGLKTSLLYYLKALNPETRAALTPDSPDLANIAASYQEAIVDALVERVCLALKGEVVRCFSAVGGVSLNSRLRERLQQLADSTGTRLLLSLPEYCVDNAAMVAGLARVGQGLKGKEAWQADACPNLEIGR